MTDPRGRDGRRLGDATLGRIAELADGWEAPVAGSARGEPALPERGPDHGAARPIARDPAPPPASGERGPSMALDPTVPVRDGAPRAVGTGQRRLADAPAPGPRATGTPVESAAARDDSPIPRPPVEPVAARPAAASSPMSDVGSGSKRLRAPVSLPRQRGVLGDVRYVYTALRGVTESRRELAGLRVRLAKENGTRDEFLLEAARQALIDERVDSEAVHLARDRMSDIEDGRSRRAGAAAAAEAEIESLRRDRAEKEAASLDRGKTLEAELAAMDERLGPLGKRAARSRREAAALQAQLDEIDGKISAAEGQLAGAADAAAVEAQLASLRAERATIAADEPAIAAVLDDVEPKIAQLTAARQETAVALAELRDAEREARIRLEEQVAAIEARRAVEERAIADCDRQRTRALRELGDALCVDRPSALASALAAIDERDVTIATMERRVRELEELVSGIDRLAVARGAAYMLAAFALVAALVWLVGSAV